MMLVRNASKGGVLLGDRIEEADGSAARRKGLMGRDALADGGGLWIAPCEAVHTFFMRFPIDVLFLDQQRKVVKVRQNLARNRISGSLRAHSVLELPAGTAARTGTETGDRLDFER
jgi:uncharacterized membrane protein (UPF0127 family)